MLCLVTGVAGFIGSHLAEALLAAGHRVRGIDSFTPYYAEETKLRNVAAPEQDGAFELVRADLQEVAMEGLLENVSVVFHQAAQPGVRGSWGAGFATYVDNNVMATQRLLEACSKAPDVVRLVYASSSSVYGRTSQYPVDVDATLAPYSPYGVTKLTAENLVRLYGWNFGLETVALRYFTVYGPRQRPDMATYRLIQSAVDGVQFRMFGASNFVRDFTYVADVVRANLVAATAAVPSGSVYNVAGGSAATMLELVSLVEEAVGRPPKVELVAAKPGDVERTGGDIALTTAELDWTPQVSLAAGVKAQADWYQGLRGL